MAPARTLGLEATRALWHPGPIDLASLQASAAQLVGKHDFQAFTPTDTQHTTFIRTVSSAQWIEVDENVIAFEITADSFLRHMVHSLVGTMLRRQDIAPLLEGGPEKRQAARTRPRPVPDLRRLLMTWPVAKPR